MKSCLKLLLLLQLFSLNLLNASSIYSIPPQDFIEKPQSNHHSFSSNYTLMDFAIMEESNSQYTNSNKPTYHKSPSATQVSKKNLSQLVDGDDFPLLQLKKPFTYLIHIKLYPFHSFW